jgi:catechol 2,3-dioxygenase-like lactoylglutathione lyase family enzyme
MTSIIDHVGFGVTDTERALAFYTAALAPLGITVTADFTFGSDRIVGFGRDKPEFWINGGATPGHKTHVAFIAARRADVDAFHAAAVAAGGVDNGGPGIRAHYHPHYYGAFVYDPDGNNIEAVCHAPE